MDYTPDYETETSDENIDDIISSETDSQSIPHPKPRLTLRRGLRRDIFEILLLIATIYTFVNLATARAVIEGQSMQPNFYTGQLVIVNRFAYYFSKPQRGDVVVLHDPNNPQQDLIKRVIGLPGETVELKLGHIYVNGVLMDEPYIEQFCETCSHNSWTMKDDEYFVLGDNRNHSLDSHIFGPINRHVIVGQAWMRYWPLQNFGFIEHPHYADVPTLTPPPTEEADPNTPAY